MTSAVFVPFMVRRNSKKVCLAIFNTYPGCEFEEPQLLMPQMHVYGDMRSILHPDGEPKDPGPGTTISELISLPMLIIDQTVTLMRGSKEEASQMGAMKLAGL
jgi:hypothetical protein